ncbi:MAG: HAD-IA family hydrolase [Candidatus Lokiarchaeia archaeon]|nr:HAD-IA family hydrolase [Candidatus Lokiarchaeia archaeon]
MENFSFETKEVLVFDLDGTIVNLKADWIILRDILVNNYNERYKEDCNIERISTCLEEIVKKKDEATLQDFFDIIREFELKNLEDIEPIEETIFFINNKELFNVREETKIVVLSLNTRNTIIKALKDTKIYNKIDFIIGREDVRKWKPAPNGLLKIQNHYNVNKNEMVFFGDLENDIMTGKNACIEAYYIQDLIELVRKKKDN